MSYVCPYAKLISGVDGISRHCPYWEQQRREEMFDFKTSMEHCGNENEYEFKPRIMPTFCPDDVKRNEFRIPICVQWEE